MELFKLKGTKSDWTAHPEQIEVASTLFIAHATVNGVHKNWTNSKYVPQLIVMKF